MQRSTAVVLPPGTQETPLQAPGRAGIIGPTVVVGLACLAVLALYPLLRGYTSPLDFAHIGRVFCCGAPAGPKASYGYDGQFYYYIATNPLHATAQMDNIPHRYQRILFPILVWILSLGGQPGLVAWWLLILPVLGAMAGTAALATLLQRRGLSPWFSLAFGLYFGQFASLTHDLPDGLAASLVICAALAADREHWKRATLWLAAACLTRELMLIFIIGMVLNALSEHRLPRAVLLLSAALPVGIWYLVLRQAFGASTSALPGVGISSPRLLESGLLGSISYVPSFLSIAGFTPRFLIFLLVILLPALVVLLWMLREALTQQWRTAPGLLFVLAVYLLWLLGSSSIFPAADLASNTRLMLGFPVAWLLYAALRRSQKLLWLALPWAAGGILYAIAVIVPFQSIIP